MKDVKKQYLNTCCRFMYLDKEMQCCFLNVNNLIILTKLYCVLDTKKTANKLDIKNHKRHK